MSHMIVNVFCEVIQSNEQLFGPNQNSMSGLNFRIGVFYLVTFSYSVFGIAGYVGKHYV